MDTESHTTSRMADDLRFLIPKLVLIFALVMAVALLVVWLARILWQASAVGAFEVHCFCLAGLLAMGYVFARLMG